MHYWGTISPSLSLSLLLLLPSLYQARCQPYPHSRAWSHASTPTHTHTHTHTHQHTDTHIGTHTHTHAPFMPMLPHYAGPRYSFFYVNKWTNHLKPVKSNMDAWIVKCWSYFQDVFPSPSGWSITLSISLGLNVSLLQTRPDSNTYSLLHCPGSKGRCAFSLSLYPLYACLSLSLCYTHTPSRRSLSISTAPFKLFIIIIIYVIRFPFLRLTNWFN